MQFQAHRSLVRVETRNVVAEIVSAEQPSPTNGIFEDAQEVICLQLGPRHARSVGRYRLSTTRDSFRDIGRLVIIPAAVPLEISASGGPVRSVRCLFAPETLQRFSNGRNLLDCGRLSAFLDFRHGEIARILGKIGQELRNPGLSSPNRIEALGTLALIELARFVDDQASEMAGRYRGGLSHRRLQSIRDYIHAEEEYPCLEDLALLTEFSVRHLTRAFKQSTGVTLYDYIEQVRLEKAQMLLADRGLLIKSIALRLGFSCPGAFSTAFRRMTGETPEEYRKHIDGWPGCGSIN